MTQTLTLVDFVSACLPPNYTLRDILDVVPNHPINPTEFEVFFSDDTILTIEVIGTCQLVDLAPSTTTVN